MNAVIETLRNIVHWSDEPGYALCGKPIGVSWKVPRDSTFSVPDGRDCQTCREQTIVESPVPPSVFSAGEGMAVYIGTTFGGKPTLSIKSPFYLLKTVLEPGIALAIANELFLVASGNDKEETP